MKTALAGLLLLLAACGGGGGSPARQDDPPVAGPTVAEQLAADLQGLALDDFYHESFKALISRSPETVVWQALTDIYPVASVGLDDMSDAYRRDTFAMYQVVLDALRAYDRSVLDADARLEFDVYEWYLQDVVDQLEFIYYDFVAAYSIFGVQEDTRTFFTDIHPLNTKDDAEDYVTRLNAVETKFGQVADHLNRQRSAGVIEPELTMRVAIDLMAVLAQGSADTHLYFTAFRDRIDGIAGLSAADRQSLLDAARLATDDSVIPGYRTLRQTMQSLLSAAPPSIGVGQYPRGNDYYTYVLRHHTTTDLTAAEIHQLGLDELQRIHFEMRLIFDQLRYPQSEKLAQLYAPVAADGGIIHAADALPTFEAIIAGAEQNLVQAFDIFPSTAVIVVPDDFGGYYIGPSFDGSRPGAFYAGTSSDLPWYDMPSLAYHEALPGHHLQIAIAKCCRPLQRHSRAGHGLYDRDASDPRGSTEGNGRARPAVRPQGISPRVADERRGASCTARHSGRSVHRRKARDALVSRPGNNLYKSAANFRDQQGAATSNSTAIARSRNDFGREKTRRIVRVISGTGH